MRKPMIAANWKMNKTVEQARALAAEMLPGWQSVKTVEQVVCPPYTTIMALSAMLEGTGIGLGAQNMHWEASGAYTGEISAAMLGEFCKYVILGHSERRTYFGETDETVNRRVKAAVAAGLIPIVCVGETLIENDAGCTAEVVTSQVRKGLSGLEISDPSRLVIAYEPVWAIGTGKAATGSGAQQVIGDMIRPALKALFGEAFAQGVRILYGGSVTGANAAEFFGQPDIDGALVGGASLKPEYQQIIEAAAN